MAYYISLWYPSHRTARRIGYYFTAAQVSASVAGLIAAGFQKMNLDRGLTGWQWMFLLYGLVTLVVGVALIWWLPDRPAHLQQEETKQRGGILRLIESVTPSQQNMLTLEEQALHRADLDGRFVNVAWGLTDLWNVLTDFRIWPLVMMYFGVVGTGYGIVVLALLFFRTSTPIGLL